MLMPVGVVVEPGGGERMVGVRVGEPTEALVDWTVGATGSGKTWHALSRVVALAEAGRGLLYLDPHRTAVWDIKRFLAARHADRIVEIDLQATNPLGEPVSAGWNPLDLWVVGEGMRKRRVDNLRSVLPTALFPSYFTSEGKSPQTAAILRKALECLLHLNLQLPPEIQASVFCVENLLLDQEWRELVVSRLRPRDQRWWQHTFPIILGRKGASSGALKPALNALEQWKSQDRVQALLGASRTTLRWRDIIDGGKILLVVLNNDQSETDRLLARLLVGEMITAFKEKALTHRGVVRPFHLFLDEFQSYAPVLEAQAGVMVQELRKFGAKVHFINQSPTALSPKMREIILSNRTHLFCGRLGSPQDADIITKAIGHQPRQQNVGLEARDLISLPRWHFVCQITHNGKLSAPFGVRGLDADRTWAHLETGTDITDRIIHNTGLQPVEDRLDHHDTLPARIARWLQHQQPPAIHEVTDAQPPQTDPTPLPEPDRSDHSGQPVPAQPRQTDPDTEQARVFNTWVSECITEDPDAATPTALLTASYVQFCQIENRPSLPERAFQKLLTQRYGPSQTARIGGKVTRVRRGIKPTSVTV